MSSAMLTHTLDPLKGYHKDHALMKTAPIDSGVTLSTFYQGTVVSLNSDGEFVVDLASAGAMPMFLWRAGNSPDVSTVDASAEPKEWYPIQPRGNTTAFVATGGFELETTEFVAGSIAPNNKLTTDGSGKLTKTTNNFYGATPIVGIASAAPRTNHHKQSVLSFWTVYFPGN